MGALVARRFVALGLLWILCATETALGQPKLDGRVKEILTEVGRVRVLVTMAVPEPGEAQSFVYRQPAGFVASILGESARHVRRIAGLPVAVAETDGAGIDRLVESTQVAGVFADEPSAPRSLIRQLEHFT